MMPKSKVMRTILIFGSELIIIGVFLMGWMLTTDEKRSVIEVRLEDGIYLMVD